MQETVRRVFNSYAMLRLLSYHYYATFTQQRKASVFDRTQSKELRLD